MENVDIKRAYKSNSYYASLNVVDIDVNFLSQFIGNSRRLDAHAFEDLRLDILAHGLEHPLYLVVGKEDKKVRLGEGNHRLQILKELGCTVVPVLIEVKRVIYSGGGYQPRHYTHVNSSVRSQNPTLSEVFTALSIVHQESISF